VEVGQQQVDGPEREAGVTNRSVSPAPNASPKLSVPQRAIRKLGLVRDIDLALHLLQRYEDETSLTPIHPDRHRLGGCEAV
jgi:ATP-dependent DNA helicase RecG